SRAKVSVFPSTTLCRSSKIEIGWGAFAQSVIDFIIIAFAIFMVIRLMNKAQERFAKKPEAEKPAPPEDILLLREIRDSLKGRPRSEEHTSELQSRENLV